MQQFLDRLVLGFVFLQVHHLALPGGLETLDLPTDAIHEQVGVLGQDETHLSVGVHVPQLGVGLVGGHHVGDAPVPQEVDDLEVQGVIDAMGELGEEGGPFGAVLVP